MKKKKIISMVLVGLMGLSMLSGCSSSDKTTDDTADAEYTGDHEPIVMQIPNRNMADFIELLHEKYPEINLQIDTYSGGNYTAYVLDELKAGDIPDIYCTTVFNPDFTDYEDLLVDLSGYDFTDNYAESRIRDVTVDGAVYLLPAYYNPIGITYNKTLLEKNGWELPTSFKELEELAPKVKEAGYNLALDDVQYPGYGFQFLFNILSTDYINTPEGHQWQKDFLNGETTVEDSPEMIEALKQVDKWREIGMFNDKSSLTSDHDTRKMLGEGNTLFLLGNDNVFKEGETEDEFGLMPYLSEDGTQNAFILNVSRYIGISKRLEEKGNEQKLEDALHVMEVLSTVEGMSCLRGPFVDTSLLPLKDYTVTGGMYADILDQLNAGVTAPFVYSGWENAIVSIGNEMISYIRGEAELDDIIKAFDDNQSLIDDADSIAYTKMTEKLDNDDCAKLVGMVFAESVGADMALVSRQKWYPIEGENTELNTEAINGTMLPINVTDQEITAVIPTGWRGNIQTVTLTGKRVKELAEEGYNKDNLGLFYPYSLITPDGFEIEDDKTYTVVITGVTDDVAKEGNLTDTGVLGLTAMQEYFSRFKTYSKADLKWE